MPEEQTSEKKNLRKLGEGGGIKNNKGLNCFYLRRNTTHNIIGVERRQQALKAGVGRAAR